MGDFYSKIIVASAFGVISERAAGELSIIRNVRNVFAHATANLSFETYAYDEDRLIDACARGTASAMMALREGQAAC
jgi:hypothetical protein